MPRYYFDCLSNGVLHPDESGIEVLDEEIADQAQAVIMNMMEESLPNKASMVTIVTVRAEQGKPVYVAHGVFNGTYIEEAPAYFFEKTGEN